jgi:hypothetical protein
VVLPLVAGIDPRFALGSLHDEALPSLARRWREKGADDIAKLRRFTHGVCLHPAGTTSSWNDELTRRSMLVRQP